MYTHKHTHPLNPPPPPLLYPLCTHTHPPCPDIHTCVHTHSPSCHTHTHTHLPHSPSHTVQGTLLSHQVHNSFTSPIFGCHKKSLNNIILKHTKILMRERMSRILLVLFSIIHLLVLNMFIYIYIKYACAMPLICIRVFLREHIFYHNIVS